MPTPFPILLRSKVTEALQQISSAEVLSGFVPEVSATADPRFGDYQTTAAMVLAKKLRTNPRQLATDLIGRLDLAGLCTPPEIAGPGFINFRLAPEAVASRLLSLVQDDRLGVPQVAEPKTIVIDFSAPNVAKPMHVGHIRSTIIGDCLARVARFLGHHVITDNHIGDWGTQFGMIIYGWKRMLDPAALQADPIAEFLRIYQKINSLTKEDPSVLDACRSELVKLQQGDPENLEIWKKSVELSLQGLARIYEQLGVSFDHYLGESSYNPDLEPLVNDLVKRGIARESDGAICIFSDGTLPPAEDPFKIQKDGDWLDLPAMIRKSDGGFNYATTDLATINYRVREWKADQIWYVVGAPQQLHFRQVFAAARQMGHKDLDLRHIAFGSILGTDRKPFRTRSGTNVGLVEVLDEAIERARAFLVQREAEDDKFVLPEEEKPDVARVVGLGSVKYAEVSQARMTDYVFDWDKMLSLKGNTAPYLLYSYVRTQGIFRKAGEDFSAPESVALSAPEEVALAMKLIQYGEVVPEVLNDSKPNVLASYLYELAKSYHSFFAACPVLKAEEKERASRLLLCELTSRVLRHGLDLLGIAVTERM